MSEEQTEGLVLARIRSSGLALRYCEGTWSLDSVGQLTADQVRGRDEAGALIWVDDAARTFFFSLPAATHGRAGFAASAPAQATSPGDLSNAAASTGMYLGLASILLSFIGIIPILAVVFSSIGLAKASDRAGTGRVQAWVGLVLGILYTFVYLYQYGHLG